MMKFREVFEDFIELVYKTNKFSINRNNTLTDFDLADYIILRVCDKDYKILYLYSGSSLVIPMEWIDLFTKFNSYSGVRFLSEYSDNDFDDKSIEKLGYLFTLLCSILSDRRLCDRNCEILGILGDICYITTKDFREWCNTQFEIELSPLIYNDLKLDFEKKYI